MGLVRPPIVFYVFDLLQLNGKDLQGLPIEERKAKMEALLKKPPGVIRYSVLSTGVLGLCYDRHAQCSNNGLSLTAVVPGRVRINAGWINSLARKW
jgi:hypothetical protein